MIYEIEFVYKEHVITTLKTQVPYPIALYDEIVLEEDTLLSVIGIEHVLIRNDRITKRVHVAKLPPPKGAGK